MFKYFLLVSVSFLSLGVTDVYSKGTRASLETTAQWEAYCTRKIQQHRGQTKQNFYAALLSAFENDGEFLPPSSARDKESEARKPIREKYDQQTVAHILSETQTTNSPPVITDVYELATAYRHSDQGRVKGLAWRMFDAILKNPTAEPTLKARAHLGKSKIYGRFFLEEKSIKEVKKGLIYDFPQLHVWLGNTWLALRKTEDGVSYLKMALSLSQHNSDYSYYRLKALIGLGNARDGDQKPHYRAALELAVESGNKELQAQALIGLGNARDGAHTYREALTIAEEIRNKDLQAQALIGLGNARDGNDKEYYRAALKLAEEIRNKDLQVQALIGLGNARDGDRIGHYREALKLAEEIENKDLQAQALIGLGNVCAASRDNTTALDYFNEALSLVKPGSEFYQKAEEGRDRTQSFLSQRGAGTSSLPSSSSNGQGQKRSYSHVDDSAERDSSSSSQSSLSHGERRSDHQNRAALELAKKSGNKELQAQALIGLGNARDGDRIGHYREALKLAEEIGNKGLQAQALIGLGNARDGNDKEHYRAAFELAKKIGSKELQAQALIGLGNARDGAHNYRVALKLAEEIKNKDLQAQALIGLGNARDGDRIGHYREALKLAEEIKDKDLQAQALIGLGNACAGRRNNQDALTYFEDALSRVNPGSELYKKAEVGRSRAEYFLPVESMKANSQGSSATPSSSKDHGQKRPYSHVDDSSERDSSSYSQSSLSHGERRSDHQNRFSSSGRSSSSGYAGSSYPSSHSGYSGRESSGSSRDGRSSSRYAGHQRERDNPLSHRNPSSR